MEDANTEENESIETVNDTNDEDEGEEIQEQVELNKTTIQMLKKNDSSINHLSVQLNCDYDSGKCPFFNSIDWKEDGYCITNNTHLKTIEILHIERCLSRTYDQPYILGEQGRNLPTRQQLQDFFSCIYRNRSIEHISFNSICLSDEFGGDLIEGLSGHPSLTEFAIHHGKIDSLACSALGKVLKHPQSKLKELRLHDNYNIDNQGFSTLCDSLLDNSRMKRLSLTGYGNQITSVGLRKLSAILEHPNCKLIDLELRSKELNDNSANILSSALSGSSIKALSICYNNSISSEGWQTFMNQLSQTPIEKLNLRANGLAAFASTDTLKSLDLSNTKIDDTALAALADMCCSNMKSLDLNFNRSITPSGWQSFFDSLRTRATQLVRLGIYSTNIGNEGAAALGSLLSNTSTLKTLQMSRMNNFSNDPNNITPQGWVSLLTSLQESNLNLMRLDLSYNNIDDEGIQLLVPLLLSMSSLKCLRLGVNHSITPTGWQALTDYLQSPNFALEELHIDENNVDDDTVVAFASALADNKTLKQLGLSECHDEDGNYSITKRGWEAVSTLVCNKTSIMDTYHSNHKMFVDYSNENELPPDDLSSLLELNENKGKAEVARQKILQTHFPGEDTSKVQEFLDMELEVMPTAISWIGRLTPIGWNGTKVSGFSTMFNLTRRVPDLFDSRSQKKPSSKGKR